MSGGGDGRDAPRYLIVRLGSLGDVIHAIPAAAALRARSPLACIDWLVDPRYADVVRMVRGVDRAITVNPRGPKGALWATLSALRRERYDAAFDVQGLIKSAVLTRLAAAQRTVGMPAAHLREPLARWFYSETPDLGGVTHVIHKALALVATVGARAVDPMFPLNIPDSEAATQVAVRHASGFVLLNPGGAWPNKQWPVERFGALAAKVQADRGLPSIVLWGPGEQALAEAVVAAARGAAWLSPPTGILDLFGLAKAARLVVSGDTGPLHIACAVGAPVVALFGPTIAARNGPWDAADRVIARTDGCGCLYQRECRRATRCIDGIEVDEVAAAVGARLETGRA